MHDLMHDLAIEVAGNESKRAELEDKTFDANTHHCSLAYSLMSTWEIPSCMLRMKHLRTFYLTNQLRDASNFNTSVLRQLMSNFRCLRLLNLGFLEVKRLPKSIGKLIHLRYLNLSANPMAKLPSSISRLENLQTLKLRYCSRLRALPINIRKLTNLRNLDLDKCFALTHMPSGIGELTSLWKLNLLLLDTPGKSGCLSKHTTAALRDLKNLNNITGALRVEILGDLKDPVSEAKEADLASKHHLTEFHIQVAPKRYEDCSGSSHDEAVLEGLKPPSNLRQLEIYSYRGRKLPSWGMNDNLCTNLPNLGQIELMYWGRCLQLPPFSKLPFLKCLSLGFMESLEYLESGEGASSQHSPADTTFFPSLRKLKLRNMDGLKGWWNEIRTVVCDIQQEILDLSDQQCLLPMSFPKLAKLKIQECPNMVTFPLCPSIEELTLLNVNGKFLALKKLTGSVVMKNEIGSSSAFTSKLKTLTTDNSKDVISMPKECLQQLTSLEIQDSSLLDTIKLRQVFKSLSSLRCLKFTECSSLRSVSKDLGVLTALESLTFSNCKELDLCANQESKDENGGMPWKVLKQLQSLQIHMIPKVVHLPSELQHLINLRSLEIVTNDNLIALPEWICCFTSLEYIFLYRCPKLTSLPEGFRKLTNLNTLYISECPRLIERCRRPNGSEWPKIQHIPKVVVVDKFYFDTQMAMSWSW